MAHYLPTQKVADIMERIRAGQSVRTIAAAVGVAKNTVQRYRDAAVFFEVTGLEGWKIDACPCGEKAGHRGWCWYRYSRSVPRQQFMKKWHQKGNDDGQD